MNIYASVMLHNIFFLSWVLLHILFNLILSLYRKPVKHLETPVIFCIRSIPSMHIFADILTFSCIQGSIFFSTA